MCPDELVNNGMKKGYLLALSHTFAGNLKTKEGRKSEEYNQFFHISFLKKMKLQETIRRLDKQKNKINFFDTTNYNLKIAGLRNSIRFKVRKRIGIKRCHHRQKKK